MMKKKAFRTQGTLPLPIIVVIAAAVLMFPGLSWGKSEAPYSPYPAPVYRNQGPSPGIDVSRRQQGSPQMDEDMKRNWKTYQGLTPDDKAGLREKSQRWQTLPPEERQEMRRRMDRYRELPPQDQERYQRRYQQWQTLPPEDRDRIRDRLRNWDSLSPQEQDDIRRRFQKR
jgi:hypothetical protein